MVATYMHSMYDKIRLIDRLTAVHKKDVIIRLFLASCIPFVTFVCGYYIATVWWGSQPVAVPHLIGTSSHAALQSLSACHLYPYVMGYQHNAHIEDGTIVEQVPQPGCYVKPHQTVFIVTSCQPDRSHIPSLIGMSYDDAHAYVSQHAMSLRVYSIPSMYPAGSIIAQIPQAGEAMDRSHIIVYVSQRMTRWHIMPSCVGCDLADVISFCTAHNIPVHVVNDTGVSMTQDVSHGAYTVQSHKPIAGSYIDLQRPPRVQIRVS